MKFTQRGLIGFFVLAFCLGCGATGAESTRSESVGQPQPAPPAQPAPVNLAPGPVTVVLDNRLIGQIRQIAMGADGWTAIGGSADLVLDVNCTLDAQDKITCVAYASEPYVYGVE